MITSTSNAKVKELVQLQKSSRRRREQSVFIVEGSRMCGEIPGDLIIERYVSETYMQQHANQDLNSIKTEVLADRVFAHVSDTKTPQGILCVVKMIIYTADEIINVSNPFILILDGLQDPGNLGTIFRTAEAAGVSGIIMSRECVDVYNPKVIRSTMGSIYRMPFKYADDLAAVIGRMKDRGVQIYAAHLDGRCSYDEADYSQKTAFMLGNEGNGLRREIADLADACIQIPMHGEVESLNVAVAGTVLMFEAARQRRRK